MVQELPYGLHCAGHTSVGVDDALGLTCDKQTEGLRFGGLGLEVQGLVLIASTRYEYQAQHPGPQGSLQGKMAANTLPDMGQTTLQLTHRSCRPKT